MPVDIEDVIKLLGTLSDEKNLRVNIKHSVRGGLIAGVTTALGGVLFGPPGLAFGGLAGGCTAAYLSSGKYEPLSQILWQMDCEKKQELYNAARAVIDKLDYTDIIMLGTLVSGDIFIKKQLLDIVVNHVKGKLKMVVLD